MLELLEGDRGEFGWRSADVASEQEHVLDLLAGQGSRSRGT
jgi:hypothetical protein